MTIASRIVLLTAFCLFINGCPRSTYIELYNNTSSNLSINIGGQRNKVSSQERIRLKFAARTFVVKSRLGTWKYGRSIIPYKGEDGPYFDGTIRIQVNEDGLIYALKPKNTGPLLKFKEQPEGFPIKPND
ncbi:hypothetical protein A9Q79_00405 [Methylophaga sp. 42_25_T18]|nr:hypothetical protein A9Q79_00405 [Methylophaga sp. 42_25_T18]